MSPYTGLHRGMEMLRGCGMPDPCDRGILLHIPHSVFRCAMARGGRAQSHGEFMKNATSLAAVALAASTLSAYVEMVEAAEPPAKVGPPVIVTATRFSETASLPSPGYGDYR